MELCRDSRFNQSSVCTMSHWFRTLSSFSSFKNKQKTLTVSGQRKTNLKNSVCSVLYFSVCCLSYVLNMKMHAAFGKPTYILCWAKIKRRLRGAFNPTQASFPLFGLLCVIFIFKPKKTPKVRVHPARGGFHPVRLLSKTNKTAALPPPPSSSHILYSLTAAFPWQQCPNGYTWESSENREQEKKERGGRKFLLGRAGKKRKQL